MTNIDGKKRLQGLSSTWSGKPTKKPRPERVNLIFEAIQNGLRECITLAQGDIELLQNSIEHSVSVSTAQGKLYELTKQCKSAERYLKRLEFELAKLEELKDQYDLHLRMRQGVKTMAYAYTLSSGPERGSALSSVRSGYKECTEALCMFETQLESMIGSLLLQMKGIQGFARLCPGDVFEITIKHGDSQKWKTRGKILKNGNQQWESEQILMKALIGEKLIIKAVEVRGLGKNIVLGNKTCETKDLFCARPQMMTINLNSIGTLKLNLITTWNPLHCAPNDSTVLMGRNFHSSSSLLRLTSSKTLPNLFSSPFSSASSSKSKLRNSTSLLSPARVAEIIDADFYIHRSPSSVSNKVAKIDSKGVHTPTPSSTSTSSGSRGSSLHLTGTSGFGSASGGSGSSYCGSSSVPNSALTSPDTEIPPDLNLAHPPEPQKSAPKSTSINNLCLKQTTEKLLKEMGKSSQEIIVQATVHQSCSSLEARSESVTTSPASSNSTRNSYSRLSSRGSCPQILNQRSLVSAHSMANVYFSISDILINLISSLEDIQGQYSEIHALHQSILELYSILKATSRLRGVSSLPSTPYSSCSQNDNRFTRTKKDFHHKIDNNGHHQHRRRASSASDISISVEHALECFDFLNNAAPDSDQDSSPEHTRSPPNGNHSSGHLGEGGRCGVFNSKNYKKIAASCDSPLSQRYQMMEKCSSRTTLCSLGSTPSPIASPQPLLTSGSKQLDIALMFHLNYCQRLIQNLGAFGPLRRREQRSLEKLSCQGMVIHRLTKLCLNLCEYLDECSNVARIRNSSCVDNESSCFLSDMQKHFEILEKEYVKRQEKELSYLRQDSRTRKLWDTVCYQNCSTNSEEIGSMLICVNSGQFAQTLESYMRAFLTPSPSNGSSNPRRNSVDMYRKVSQLITARLIDTPLFEADLVVTIFQVAMFFRQENSGLEYLFKSYSEEISLIDSIQTDNVVQLKQALNRFKKTLPPQEPLFNISLLLLHSDPLVVGIAEAYFTECSKNKTMRAALLEHFIEGLEVDSRYVRQASCRVLRILKANEYMKQLAYISQADDCDQVREQAKKTLFACGSDGRKIYNESQLFAHGFQRLAVK